MKSKYKSLKLENQISFPIYLCSKEIIRKYTPLLDEINLTYTQYIVMMFFWEKGESNVRELGKTLLLDSSTLTPLLKKLESKGYVTRVRSTVDERNLVIKVTEKGMDLRDKVLSIPNIIRKCVKLTREEEKTLCELSCKVLRNIQEEEE